MDYEKLVIPFMGKLVEVLNITGQKWADKDNTHVTCKLTLSNDMTVPFNAFPTDPHDHGRQLFDLLVDGKRFGPPAPFMPDLPELAGEARRKRNKLIAATDWTQAPDVPAETSAKWGAYRKALRDVPAQEGFPEQIDWPVSP